MTTLPTAQELLKHARKERELLRTWLASMDDFIRNLERFLGMRHTAEQVTMENIASQSPATSLRFKGATSVAAAEIILRENGAPMHLDDIIDAILKGGYEKQRDQKKLYFTLFANLARKAKVFAKVPEKPATFGLVEWSQKR